MRMRIVKRDFWESEEIGALSPFTRFLLIALWSYVDDNGVRTDSAVSIAAECFRYDLAHDTPGTLAAIAAGLDELWRAGWITRYSVGGGSYLEISEWNYWQNPQRPSKPRYPRSTDTDALVRAVSMRPSRDSLESVERVSCPDTEPESESESDTASGCSKSLPKSGTALEPVTANADRRESFAEYQARAHDIPGPEERAHLDARADRIARDAYG
jgi:hypothetical protein